MGSFWAKIRYHKNNSKAFGFGLQTGRPWAYRFEPGWLADIFFELQLWPLISLQPLDQNHCLVPHLKDLFHISLGSKAQSFWMTFNICNLGSKYPYFNMAYVVSSGFGCTHLYYFSQWKILSVLVISLLSKRLLVWALYSALKPIPGQTEQILPTSKIFPQYFWGV